MAIRAPTIIELDGDTSHAGHVALLEIRDGHARPISALDDEEPLFVGEDSSVVHFEAGCQLTRPVELRRGYPLEWRPGRGNEGRPPFQPVVEV